MVELISELHSTKTDMSHVVTCLESRHQTVVVYKDT